MARSSPKRCRQLAQHEHGASGVVPHDRGPGTVALSGADGIHTRGLHRRCTRARPDDACYAECRAAAELQLIAARPEANCQHVRTD
jgi:hypothetical protein